MSRQRDGQGVFSNRKTTIIFLVAAVAIAAEVVLHIVGAGPLWRSLFLAVGGVAALTLILLLRRQRPVISPSARPTCDEGGDSIGRTAKVWLIEAAVVWAVAIVLAVAGAAVSTWVGFLFAGSVFGLLGLYYVLRQG